MVLGGHTSGIRHLRRFPVRIRIELPRERGGCSRSSRHFNPVRRSTCESRRAHCSGFVGFRAIASQNFSPASSNSKDLHGCRKPCRIKLRMRLYRLPWEAIAAGIFMARATDGGMAFAQAVRGYLMDVMERALSLGKPFWYADQAALYYCWHDRKDEIEASRFRKPAFKQVGSWKLFQGDEERIRFLEG